MQLALALFACGPVQDHDAGAVSANGRFEARIARAPGQERVADRLARRLLTVRDTTADPAGEPLWESAWRELLDPGARYLVSDDGSTFVAVASSYQLARAVVRVFRFGEQTDELVGRDIGLERGEFTLGTGETTWLSDPEDSVQLAWRETPDGPALVLELGSVLGWTRDVDLTQGGLLGEAAPSSAVLRPGVDPRLRNVVQAARVTKFNLPARVLGGLPVVVHLEGTFPTANWQLCGFDVEVLDAAGFELLITPQTRPGKGALAGQVITAFRGQAELHGLVPGRYLIYLRGSEPQEHRLPARSLEVLPSRLRASLRTTGGIAGIDETIELFAPGILRLTSGRTSADTPPRYVQLSPERQADLERALGLLAGERPGSRKTQGAADFLEYHLEWWSGEDWLAVDRDDGTIADEVGPLIHALQRSAN